MYSTNVTTAFDRRRAETFWKPLQSDAGVAVFLLLLQALCSELIKID